MAARDHVLRSALAALAVPLALSLSPVPADAGCPPVPRPVCGSFGQVKFAANAFGQVVWRAKQGPPTAEQDFGDPDTTSHYFLCAWDENGLVIAADIPPGVQCAGQSCWCSLRSGLRYEDPDGSNGDLRRLDLSDDGDKGATIRADTQVVGGINLPVYGDLLVQLSRSDSDVCFESLILAEDFQRNDRRAVLAVSEPDTGR